MPALRQVLHEALCICLTYPHSEVDASIPVAQVYKLRLIEG